MTDEVEVTEQDSIEMEHMAIHKARTRAQAARWDLDVALFFFAVLTIVIILLFQDIRIEIVSPIAILGLAMGWLMGWRKGKQVFELFYNEELSKLVQELKKAAKATVEETIEEKVQKALRDRWK
jgi:xanthine/uracil permease